MIEYYQKSGAEIEVYETKNYIINYARYTTLKNHFYGLPRDV